MSFTLRSFVEDAFDADAATGNVKALQRLVAKIGENIISTQTALNSAATVAPAAASEDIAAAK